MRFNPKARLDTRRVRDRGRGGGGVGGGGGRGGAGIPIPGGLGIGGGLGGVIIVVLILVLTQCVGGGDGSPSTGGGGTIDDGRMGNTARYAGCQTGEDANNSSDCALVAVENSLYDYWRHTLGDRFEPEHEVDTFSGGTSTACGRAGSAMGPFYCPADQTIYLDTTFFHDILQGRLGGPSGAFVEPYVIAHEYGHHIQNLLGTMSKVKTQQGATSDSVRLELQADCYAGMWAKSATTTDDATGQALFSDLTDADIEQAIAAATAVGDDRIQQRSGGRVNPEQWTHGSAEERVRWFRTGYEQGSLEACDTFSASRL